jgi:hypothetical protein
MSAAHGATTPIPVPLVMYRRCCTPSHLRKIPIEVAPSSRSLSCTNALVRYPINTSCVLTFTLTKPWSKWFGMNMPPRGLCPRPKEHMLPT